MLYISRNYILLQSLLIICFILFLHGSLFSQTLDATLLELKFSNDGNPEKLTEVDNGFFFSAQDDQLWFSDGSIENTFLVKDFNSGYYDDIANLTAFGSSIIFSAYNGSDNQELWISDGTESGTIQLIDRNVEFSTENINNIILYKGKVYFCAYRESIGYELWVSDGTPSGTFVLKDIAVGEESSSPNNFFTFEDMLFFTAFTPDLGAELWVTDGTSTGTELVKDINIGSLGSLSYSQEIIVLGPNFYFYANNGTTGNELWKSDGTLEGTKLVSDIRSGYNGSNTILDGEIINNKLVFIANDGVYGKELWETDGTLEGTILLKDINPGEESSITFFSKVLQTIGNKLFFTASDGANQDGLWVSDGTSQGTYFVSDHQPLKLAANNTEKYAIYFANNENNQSVLWKTDGTTNGTIVLSEDIEVTNTSLSEQDFLSFGNYIFFNGYNKVNGNELWVTDGTSENTKLFFDLDHRNGVNPSLLTPIGDRLFFRGNSSLCSSDGTIEGTKYLSIGSNEGGIDTDSEFIDFNGKLVVSAHDGIHGFELWMSDVTQEDPKMIKDIYPGSGSSMYNSIYLNTLAVINDKIYFMANDGIHGYEFWISDGTESGTYMVKDLRQAGSNYHSYPTNFVELNGMVYFHAMSNSGDALWITDGTEGGTKIVKILNDIRELRTVNNKLIIVAETSGTSYGPHDLWVSDGTTEGTLHLKTFGDNINSNIRFMTILNDELYFVAKEPSSYYRSVYKTNGTIEGTVLLFSDRDHPIYNLDIGNIFTCGNYVYFGVQESLSNVDKELWRTDGTVAGTISVALPNENFSYFQMKTCFNGYLLYSEENFTQKLWLSNGQANEAVQFAIEVQNGPNFLENDKIGYMQTVGEKLFFEARTDYSGAEIYVATPDFSTLSIDDFNISHNDNIKKSIKIYPNPTTEMITLKSDGKKQIKSFELFNMLGKRIYKKENKSLANEMIYDVSKLPRNIYLIRIHLLDGNVKSAKLIVN